MRRASRQAQSWGRCGLCWLASLHHTLPWAFHCTRGLHLAMSSCQLLGQGTVYSPRCHSSGSHQGKTQCNDLPQYPDVPPRVEPGAPAPCSQKAMPVGLSARGAGSGSQQGSSMVSWSSVTSWMERTEPTLCYLWCWVMSTVFHLTADH